MMPLHSGYSDDTVTQLIQLAAQDHEITAMWLYGSRARGNHRVDSDYDVAVLFTSRIEDPLERRLRPELLALDWTKSLELKEDQLSIVDVKAVPIPLAMNIISGILLYCNDWNARLMAERIIMSKAELDYHYHLKHFGS